jgi:hypothetical protein
MIDGRTPGANLRARAGEMSVMDVDERRVLTEDEAFRLLAHLVATAELHTIEPPHYAGRRILEGLLPLLDALIRDGDERSRAWLEQFRQEMNHALEARRADAGAFEAFLGEAPGEIVREIKRRRASAGGEGSDDAAARARAS